MKSQKIAFAWTVLGTVLLLCGPEPASGALLTSPQTSPLLVAGRPQDAPPADPAQPPPPADSDAATTADAASNPAAADVPSPPAADAPPTTVDVSVPGDGAAAPASGPASQPADVSLSRYAPADCGFFVEIRDAPELLTALTEPRLWTALADVAGQPSGLEDAAQWRQRVQATVGMSPEEAIRVLFARGAAFAGEGLGRSQDAVVIGRPGVERDAAALLKQWHVVPLSEPDLPDTWTLRDNIGVARVDDVLIFGDLIPPDGAFRRLVRQLHAPGGAPPLAADPTFQRLRAAVEPGSAGLLFARTAAAASTQPASLSLTPTTAPAATPPNPAGGGRGRGGAVGPLGDARAILLALRRVGAQLRFTAVGDQTAGVVRDESPRLIENLPQDTLAALEFPVRYGELRGLIERLPEGSVFQLAARLPKQMERIEVALEALGPRTCIAIGPGDGPGGAPPAPAVAMLISTPDPAGVEADFDALFQSVVTLYDFFALARGLPPLPRLRESVLDDALISTLDLTPLVSAALGDVGPVELCWTVDNDALLIATQERWLRRILDARTTRGPSWRTPSAIHAAGPPDGPYTLVVRSREIAELAQRWLDHLRRTRPEVLEEGWWRARQPGGDQNLLGIDVVQERPHQRLRIRAVQPDGPAAAHLRVGDHIVGANGRRFRSEQVIREIRRAIERRPNARWIELLVLRDQVVRPIRISTPFLNPIETLERLVALGALTETIAYADTAARHELAAGVLTLDLRAGAGVAGTPRVAGTLEAPAEVAAEPETEEPEGPRPPASQAAADAPADANLPTDAAGTETPISPEP